MEVIQNSKLFPPPFEAMWLRELFPPPFEAMWLRELFGKH